ncbi:head decoration protein [Mesorhizobium sp. M2A.F.Ca.ET.067.02.1.1]|uniref:head decoration protein n=1 Tax=Mesorhizobium sp. M2A.F.Ca.ET.067.02.1.1 TaxID=2496749 RepID=UPI000FD61D59|nr:head decoration protein [Mesorhizobium sp. M2A.F.Ca.ET.067.02.1.1]RUW60292.1 head decoration protein [Mesorhizobium sp. M2A.F.Ca.ET.067.02.1.1]
MTDFTENLHSGTYLAFEVDPQISRETGTVASGQDLVVGQLVMLSGGNLVAHDGALNTAGDVVSEVEGIMFDAVDATGGAVSGAVYTKRLSTVKDDDLTYPTESTAGGEKAACIASMAANNIIVR